ncbi:MAG: hypothetical protein FJ290_26355 [Planctomycetes bacterium]|nr:hypothetical protein [Planctomycetota bacterium]
MRKQATRGIVPGSAEYYDSHGVLDDLVDEPVEFSLAEGLREEILHGRRRRPKKNLSLKIDPLHEQAIRKLATMRAVPFQTLIRQWIAERLASELKS